MKTYNKSHTEKAVALNHMLKIEKRGGTAKLTEDNTGYHITYQFPEKKQYDVISPDGFSIRIGVPPFTSIKARDAYFKLWKERFKQQGYYSSTKFGRIDLLDLSDFCEWIEL